MVASTLLLAFGLAAQVFSLPVSPRDETERYFLADCSSTENFVDGTTQSEVWSEIEYYSYDATSRSNNPKPTASMGVLRFATAPWEGVAWSGGQWPDGDVFTSHIAAGAQNLPDFAFAGTANNLYRNFNCYKDNNRLLTREDSANGAVAIDCHSRYYCLLA